MFPSLIGEENLEVGAMLPRARAQARANDGRRCSRCFRGWRSAATQTAGTMSGGEQQMLAIGRCLMGPPELDHVRRALAGPRADWSSRDAAHHPRGSTRKRHHRPAGRAERRRLTQALAQHAYVLETGRVVLEGPGAELLGDPRVREAYLGM